MNRGKTRKDGPHRSPHPAHTISTMGALTSPATPAPSERGLDEATEAGSQAAERENELLVRIGELPGAHLRQLHRATGIPLGTTARALQRLEESGAILVEEINTYRRYYPKRGIHRRERIVLAHVASLKSRNILLALLDTPGASHTELRRVLDIPGPTLSYYLSRLERDELVKVRSKRNRRYFRLKNPELVERALARWPEDPPV